MIISFKKAGILAATLLIPAFIFLFLHFFGKNSYDLPYYFPKLDERGEIQKNGADTIFNQIPSFELINQAGKTFGSAQMEGKLTAISFFFTRCGTICPRLSTELTRVQQNFKGNPLVQIASISIDPKHDSVAVLQNYAKKYGAVDGQWNLLTGSKEYIYDLAIKGFKLPVADASAYDPTITNVDDMFIHSDKVLLIDGKGYVRGIYEGTSKEDIERLIGEIKVLLSQLEKPS